ncbi:DUF2779 domain-containing protein [Aromatoleum evansii]|uniref:DUF2779 domain-containing protein n=1 Tax=Aromatoleum evansii TaxID=59406 RepID=UPI00145E09F8|nr:DUF2779 domain-containing protein [Aromatoleum evansii]NMG31760.1 DUF2779 domain-containing protein [Aromatoleum evansii]
MRALSKSKLLAYLQCPKRLWLELHRPELREDSAATQASYTVGHTVGDIARRIYDKDGKAALIDVGTEGFDGALARSQTLLAGTHPIFEAGFSASGAVAFADVLLPVRRSGKKAWRMVEVKSSTSVKDYHRCDTAIQAFVAREAKVPLAGIALAHIDTSWVYPGNDDYAGLLVEEDLTEEAFGKQAEVRSWIAAAQAVARRRKEPVTATGRHCNDPYDCGFSAYCLSQGPQAEYPVSWLPQIRAKALKARIEEDGAIDLREIEDDLLNETQLRVKTHTLAGTTYFDRPGANADLSHHKLPAFFLDFETITFPVPIWKGTRPYQQIPFQFSLHRLSRTGKLNHTGFLDLSGKDPSRTFAEALLGACDEHGPIFVYNAAFETARIKELAARFPRLRRPLDALLARVVDLLPVARERYYHPDQHGSWSIKAVLPTISPDLSYDSLTGVQDGGMAMGAFLEAVSPMTAAARKEAIRGELQRYCELDTLAMVRLWAYFKGRALPA